MDKKKILWICMAAALVLLMVIGTYNGYQNRVYHETYILIDGVEYLRACDSLDLSGKPLGEVEKLQELTGLKTLNLLDCGITQAQYEALQAALPECRITWSVPFQGGYLSNELTCVTVKTLSQEDVAQFRYLPALSEVQATGCQDYDVLMKLEADRPDLTVFYTVPFSNVEYSNHAEAIIVSDPELTELMEGLSRLPRVKEIRLKGTPMANEDTLALISAYPELDFTYQVTFQDLFIDSDAEFIDLSGIPLEDTGAVEALLPLLPNLTKVDMLDCGISNEEMDALNARHRDVLFVWKVYVSSVALRTDVEHFMPVQLGIGSLGNLYNLRYCKEIRVLDFGHYTITNLDFIEYMPKLEYLLLHSAPIMDTSVIGNCTTLRFLEIMNTKVTDFWPLTNLTNLEDLNISYTPYLDVWEYGSFGDITPLMQMTWLDRLWMVNSRIGKNNRLMLQEILPGTIIHHFSGAEGSVQDGWRHSLNYYKHRDILGMWYMT